MPAAKEAIALLACLMNSRDRAINRIAIRTKAAGAVASVRARPTSADDHYVVLNLVTEEGPTGLDEAPPRRFPFDLVASEWVNPHRHSCLPQFGWTSMRPSL